MWIIYFFLFFLWKFKKKAILYIIDKIYLYDKIYAGYKMSRERCDGDR
ncbi:hypothetical protein GND98_008135 [Clostridium butyricum]|uniref:Uncharacterized protein n=1 Tax=Clostridium butyricum TaxID=1492 RepID=A0A6L9ENF5_CLOBU|nr:hypothetical protein [Clostridium butyricum]